MDPLGIASVSLNLLVLLAGGAFLYRKGGLAYLRSRYLAAFVQNPFTALDAPFHESPYCRSVTSVHAAILVREGATSSPATATWSGRRGRSS